MKICAIVVTYNRKELLYENIESLLNQTYKLNKIIIIDNNSNDGTEKYLRETGVLQKEVIKYIKLPENVGGAGGFNKGLEFARAEEYDWVWVMDDDTIPTKNALQQLLMANETIEGEVSFLCSKVIGPKNEEMNLPNISQRIGENGYKIWMKYLNKSIVEVESATFVSVLIKYDAIKKVGLPWAQFFIWGDDIEYTLRLSKYYAPGFVVGNSIVVHKRFNAKNITIVSEENINRINFYKYKYRNDILIASAYGNIISKLRVLANIIKDIFKIFKSSPGYKFKKVGLLISSSVNGLFNMNLRRKFDERFEN